MKQWKIPVTWEMCGIVTVKADTLEGAMDIARNDDGVLIPEDGGYVDGSWDLSMDDEETVRECYNNNQTDEEGD